MTIHAKTQKSSSNDLSLLGVGATAIHGNSTHYSAFGDQQQINSLTRAVEAIGKEGTERELVFLADSHHLHQLTTQKTGLSVDLGFFKIGKKGESSFEMEQSAKNIYIFSYAKKNGQSQVLDASDILEKHKESYRKNKKAFYKDFGSHYIRSRTRGFYCYLLIEIKCESASEAKDRKKQLEASAKSENGSGSASIGNDKSFSSLCQSFGAKTKIKHNLKLENSKLKDFSDTSVKDCLALVDFVDTQKIDENTPFVSFELAAYPGEEFNEIYEKINEAKYLFLHEYQMDKNGPKYQKTLNDLKDYFDYQSNYEEEKEINSSFDYYDKILRVSEEELDNIDENIFYDIKESKKSIKAVEEKYKKPANTSSITPKKLKVELKEYTSDKSGADAIKDTIDNITKHKGWCLKHAIQDAHGQKTKGHTFYNKEKIQPSRIQPDNNTKWSVYKETASKDVGKTDLHTNIKNWINDNLTPWQYYHCSIIGTATNKPMTSYCVIYPEK